MINNLIIFFLLFLVSCASKPIEVKILPSPEMIEKDKCIEVIEEFYYKGFNDALKYKT